MPGNQLHNVLPPLTVQFRWENTLTCCYVVAKCKEFTLEGKGGIFAWFILCLLLASFVDTRRSLAACILSTACVLEFIDTHAHMFSASGFSRGIPSSE